MDILKLLSRQDKFYLGGGNRIVWTPPFPQWLEKPGFWDKANFYNFDFDPVFTITLLNDEGVEIPLQFLDREWNPARLKQTYQGGGLIITEEKAVLPEDSLVSVFTIKNRNDQPVTLHYLAWSLRESLPSRGKNFIDNLDIINDKMIFTKFVQFRDLPLYSIHCAFGISESPDSYDINFAESTAKIPRWDYTPFYDHFHGNRLNNQIKISGINQDGLIYLALHKQIRIQTGAAYKIWTAMAFARNDDDAAEQLGLTLTHENPIAVSRQNWENYFAGLPQFDCSDPVFTRYYWYRWYGLRLFTIQGGGEPNYPHSCVCEGVSYFRVHVTYSAQCHMLETRWMLDPEIARGSLLNFINSQNEDGSFTGHIYPNSVQTNGFYHANWGNAALAVHQIHPDRQFLEKAYHGLSRYVAFFDRERDKEDSGLYDIIDQFETGQEFMSRYLAVDPNADSYDWINNIRMKGIDATTYMYQLKQALAKIAGILGRDSEQEDWLAGADKIKMAVLSLMWDSENQMFFDVNPLDFKRTNVKAAVCFYPYSTDIVDQQHLEGLKKHLLNPDEFWTEWPVPASSKDDPYFSPDAEWKGKRHNCPWNGRVWPMINSHIADALAVCAIRFDDVELKQAFVHFLQTFIAMMHFENMDGRKDFSRPNCFEHYHPFSGKASVYRGVDDYQHSWVVDLILKYVVGLSIDEENRISLKPFDFGLDNFEVTNLHIAGRSYTVRCRNRLTELIEED